MQMFKVILVWEEALQASGLTSEPSDSLQTATAVRLVESRVLYVGAKESLRNISRSGEKGERKAANVVCCLCESEDSQVGKNGSAT